MRPFEANEMKLCISPHLVMKVSRLSGSVSTLRWSSQTWELAGGHVPNGLPVASGLRKDEGKATERKDAKGNNRNV